MTKSINTQAAFVAFDKFAKADDTSRITLVKELREAGITTLEVARPIAMEWVSAKTKCPIVDGAGKATGRKVLDASHGNYEAAKKALQRLMGAFEPKAKTDAAKSGKPTAKKVDAVQKLLDAYAKLSKAEQKRFLASI
jgi:hypothetical protein